MTYNEIVNEILDTGAKFTSYFWHCNHCGAEGDTRDRPGPSAGQPPKFCGKCGKPIGTKPPGYQHPSQNLNPNPNGDESEAPPDGWGTGSALGPNG
jgi:hypothetical protein